MSEIKLENLIPTRYVLFEDSLTLGSRDIYLIRTKGTYKGYRWSIKQDPYVLTNKGKWEYEPLPSSRTDKFLERVRFKSIDDALKVWNKYLKKHQIENTTNHTPYSIDVFDERN